ncbi:HET-domain-containing protein [Whalleya microplaca]|nr:HET-domain-containing protein [Whalleya microplaca]
MNLINAKKYVGSGRLELSVFHEPNIPQYAILSHTWGNKNEEVTFSELIPKSCHNAVDRGCDYVWIDTCCIDQSSSAELSYGINSMFRWYKNSSICIVYLADYHDQEWRIHTMPRPCRWFTRGWTLQELIAPKHVVFFNAKWARLGRKKDLVDSIQQITKIDKGLLLHDSPLRESLREYSISHKMAWASNRQTQRPEDRVYSLLGIFGICMPVLYGEGVSGAFRRLQLEIIKETSDMSIFAWGSQNNSQGSKPHSFCSILAESLEQFQFEKRGSDLGWYLPQENRTRALQVEIKIGGNEARLCILIDSTQAQPSRCPRSQDVQ